MTSPRVTSARVDSALHQTSEPVFLLGADRRLLYVNRAWEELTGRPADSVLGQVCASVSATHVEDPVSVLGCFGPPPEALSGRPATGLAQIPHPQGERRWRRVEFLPLLALDGTVSNILGFVRLIEPPSIYPESSLQALKYRLLEVRQRLSTRFGIESIIGSGPWHERVLEQVKSAAAIVSPVTIIGETGTGKRLIARTIHNLSLRKHRNLLTLDCAVLPPEVIERELFQSKPRDDGRRPNNPLAEGSSLLLVNVVELHRDLQAQLVAVPDRPFRLLATSTISLEVARQDERLRPDLYFALTAFSIALQPLRDRLDEIPLLAQHLLERANQREAGSILGFDPEALNILLAYDWPGNLQELARVIEAARAACTTEQIAPEDLPNDIRGHLASAYLTAIPKMESLDELITQVERRIIELALARSRQNKSRAAELLGISRPRLYRRIKELNIPDMPENGPASDGGEPL